MTNEVLEFMKAQAEKHPGDPRFEPYLRRYSCKHNEEGYIFTSENSKPGLTLLSDPPQYNIHCLLCNCDVPGKHPDQWPKEQK